MTDLRLMCSVNWVDIIEHLKHNYRLIRGAQTCWWKLGNSCYVTKDGCQLPCGPRSEMLLEMNKPWLFVKGAFKKPEFYGSHGLATLLSAYHGNLVAPSSMEADVWYPTSLEDWQSYNDLLDWNPFFLKWAKESEEQVKNIDWEEVFEDAEQKATVEDGKTEA